VRAEGAETRQQEQQQHTPDLPSLEQTRAC
jgi:hypothetical protein